MTNEEIITLMDKITNEFRRVRIELDDNKIVGSYNLEHFASETAVIPSIFKDVGQDQVSFIMYKIIRKIIKDSFDEAS